MVQGNRGRAIAILAVILKEKNSAGLGGLLVHKGETMRAVAREQIQANQHLRPKPLLPARARGHKTRLLETACRQRELAHNRAWWNHVAGRGVAVPVKVDRRTRQPGVSEVHVVPSFGLTARSAAISPRSANPWKISPATLAPAES